MDKRITFEALSKRKGTIEPILAGTVTGRLGASKPELQNLLPKPMDTRRLKDRRTCEPKIVIGPRHEWVRTRWPDSPADLGASIHQQIDRVLRHQDHELAKAILFGNWDNEPKVNQVHDSLIVDEHDWDAMKEYCEMDIMATEQALKSTKQIMAAMEDTLELDLFGSDEPEYNGDDLMAAVRSFCRR